MLKVHFLKISDNLGQMIGHRILQDAFDALPARSQLLIHSHRNPFLHYQPIVSQKERTKIRTITVAATTVLGGLAVMTLTRIVRDWGSIPR